MINRVNPEVIIELFLICITGLPYIIFFSHTYRNLCSQKVITESNPQTDYKWVAFRLLSQRGYDSAEIGY